MSILTPPPSTALVPLVFVFCSLLATSGHCQSLLHSNLSIFELLSFGIFFIFLFSLYWPLQVIANLSCTQNTPNSIPAKKQSSDNLTDTARKEKSLKLQINICCTLQNAQTCCNWTHSWALWDNSGVICDLLFSFQYGPCTAYMQCRPSVFVFCVFVFHCDF